MTKPRPTFSTQAFLDSAGPSKTILVFKTGQVLFSQGDRGDSVVYLQRGRVTLSVLSESGREGVVAILQPGDFLGEGCLAGQSYRTGTATAIAPTRALVIGKRRMLKVLRDEPALADRFISHMLSRNIRTEQDLISLLFNSREKRLARTLLLLARRGAPGKPRQVSSISQERLSAMVGTTRSRVNFFMRKFKRLRFIDYNRDLEAGVTINSSLISVVLAERR